MDDRQRDPAVARFWMLQLLRLGGIVLVVLGIGIIAGELPLDPSLGYMLFVLGAMEFFLFPALLARWWKKER